MLLSLDYVIWLGGIIILNSAVATFAKGRAQLLSSLYKALPDLAHDYLPRLPVHVPDYLLLFALFSAIGFHDIDRQSVRSLLYCLSLRPMFVCLTTLPTCMPRPDFKTKSLFSKLFLSTHDLMFSGHTIVFLFSGSLIGGNLGSFISYLLPATLVAARQHYSIDVLVAMVLWQFFQKLN